MARRAISAAFAALACLAIPGVALAQTVADFYRDKQIRMIVSTAAGGDYDAWARLITRYWGRHIPGNPSFLIINMPGAGGIIAANSLYNVAPKDGLTIAMIGRNLAYQALMKEEGIRFDPLKLNWIGSPELSSRICVSMSDTKVQKAEDLFTQELLVGGAGAGTAVSTTPKLLSKLLGMKFKVVEGYGSASNVQLAMERNEVEGICQTVGALRAWRGEWLDNGKLKVLFNLERTPIKELGAPSILDFAKTPEQRRILTIFSSSVELGRPIVTPPGVPIDRVTALQQSFEKVMSDPDLLAEAKKLRMDVATITGVSLKELVEDLMVTPAEVLAEVQALSK